MVRGFDIEIDRGKPGAPRLVRSSGSARCCARINRMRNVFHVIEKS